MAVDAVEVLTTIIDDPTISPYARRNQQELFLSLPIKLMKMTIIEKWKELETVISIDNKDI